MEMRAMKTKKIIWKAFSITINVLCILYYLQLVLILFSVFLLSNGQMEFDIAILLATVIVIILSYCLVKSIFKHKKNISNRKDILIFKIVSISSALLFAQSLFPIICGVLLDIVFSEMYMGFYDNNELQILGTSCIIYFGIIIFLLKNYKEEK